MNPPTGPRTPYLARTSKGQPHSLQIPETLPVRSYPQHSHCPFLRRLCTRIFANVIATPGGNNKAKVSPSAGKKTYVQYPLGWRFQCARLRVPVARDSDMRQPARPDTSPYDLSHPRSPRPAYSHISRSAKDRLLSPVKITTVAAPPSISTPSQVSPDIVALHRMGRRSLWSAMTNDTIASNTRIGAGTCLIAWRVAMLDVVGRALSVDSADTLTSTSSTSCVHGAVTAQGIRLTVRPALPTRNPKSPGLSPRKRTLAPKGAMACSHGLRSSSCGELAAPAATTLSSSGTLQFSPSNPPISSIAETMIKHGGHGGVSSCEHGHRFPRLGTRRATRPGCRDDSSWAVPTLRSARPMWTKHCSRAVAHSSSSIPHSPTLRYTTSIEACSVGVTDRALRRGP